MANKPIKIAFFVEGLTETIFIRRLLLSIFDNSKIEIRSLRLFNTSKGTPTYSVINDFAEIRFLLVDVEGDSNVLSGIKEREKNFFSQGYKKIIGLRDMYSNQYNNLTKKKRVDEGVISLLISRAQSEINKMSKPTLIKLHFAIMEIEAWFIAMVDVLNKIDVRLTQSFIKRKLSFDILVIDPQFYFRKPSRDLEKVYALVGKTYQKTKESLESLMSKMQKEDFYNLYSSGKVSNYKIFFEDVTEGFKNYLSS